MARLTGMPPRADFICTMLASCAAPIQTKKAMKSRKGLVNRPMKPKSSAMPWPSVAAICVARV